MELAKRGSSKKENSYYVIGQLGLSISEFQLTFNLVNSYRFPFLSLQDIELNSMLNGWFETKRINDHLYIIRERLDLIDSRYHTKFTNMYLLLGTHSALLFDTGSGYSSIKNEIQHIMGDRELLIVNSHNHFDHIGGNSEFQSVHVHQFDLKKLTKPVDVSFLETSQSKYLEPFTKKDYKLFSSPEHNLLIGGEKINLGDLEVEILTTPGHTQGSICLLTSEKEIFTGDTVHYGAIYLPNDDSYHNYKHSLEKLDKMADENKFFDVYPAHEDYKVDKKIIKELLNNLIKLNSLRQNERYDDFLDAFYIDLEKFRFVYPLNYTFEP